MVFVLFYMFHIDFVLLFVRAAIFRWNYSASETFVPRSGEVLWNHSIINRRGDYEWKNENDGVAEKDGEVFIIRLQRPIWWGSSEKGLINSPTFLLVWGPRNCVKMRKQFVFFIVLVCSSHSPFFLEKPCESYFENLVMQN